jgi:hypothetical protein
MLSQSPVTITASHGSRKIYIDEPATSHALPGLLLLDFPRHRFRKVSRTLAGADRSPGDHEPA